MSEAEVWRDGSDAAMTLRVVSRGGRLVQQHRFGDGEWKDTEGLTAALKRADTAERELHKLQAAALAFWLAVADEAHAKSRYSPTSKEDAERREKWIAWDEASKRRRLAEADLAALLPPPAEEAP